MSYSTATNGGVNSSFDHTDNTISGDITLPSSNSSVTYQLTITNLGNTPVGISSISGLNASLDYAFTGYTEGTKLCDTNNPTSCSLGSSTTFTITIKYKANASPMSGPISFTGTVNFARAYDITYQNLNNTTNYQKSIVHGGTLTINFQTDIPTYLKITTSSGTEINNYTCVRNQQDNTCTSLTIPSITSNIIINRYYLINYNLNNGTNGNNPDRYLVGTPVTLADPIKTDYLFGGWYTTSNFSGSAITSTSQLSSDTTLHAKWVLQINYNVNGGTQPNNQVYTFMEGESIAIEDASRQYYIFNGWQNTQGTTIINTSQLTSTLRDLTANWNPMIEKTNITMSGNQASFVANNITGNVNISNLNASSGQTYTYAGVNKTGATITTVRVTIVYTKQTGKSERLVCDVYRDYATYQSDNNHTRYLGTTSQRVTQGTNTTTSIDIVLSGTNQIAENQNFIVLFTGTTINKGTFSSITIEFNP